MPTKIVESKILLKGEDQGAVGLFRKVVQGAKEAVTWMDKLGRSMAGASWGVGGGAGGAGGFGQPFSTKTSQGSQRSEYAGLTGRAAKVLEGKYTWKPPGEDGDGGGGGRSPRSPHAPPADRGFQRFARTIGYGLGGTGALLGGVTHNVTPMVGGMVSAAGGAMMGNMLTMIPGAAAMYAGTLLQGLTAVAQPAIQHYGELHDTYRRLDRLGAEGRSDRALKIGAETQAFTQAEAIRYGGQLQRFGGFEGLETMGRMRYGGFEPEIMMPFFQQATRAGAAGNRQKSDYDYLAKIIAVSFSKQGLPSVEQAIETMSGLMGNAEQYLADISKDETEQLAKMTHWMEGSGTAVLRGQRGVQTMATLYGWTAKPGDAAKEMFIWQTLAKTKPGMTYPEMRRYRETGGATMAMVKELRGQGLYGEMVLGEVLGSYSKAKEIMEAADQYGASSKKVEDLLKKADPSSTDYKPDSKKLYDFYQTQTVALDEIRMKFSKEFMPKFFETELALTNALVGIAKTLDIGAQIAMLTSAIQALERYLSGRKEAPEGPPSYASGDVLQNLKWLVTGQSWRIDMPYAQSKQGNLVNE